jgi:hypothetical protein
LIIFFALSWLEICYSLFCPLRPIFFSSHHACYVYIPLAIRLSSQATLHLIKLLSLLQCLNIRLEHSRPSPIVRFLSLTQPTERMDRIKSSLESYSINPCSDFFEYLPVDTTEGNQTLGVLDESVWIGRIQKTHGSFYYWRSGVNTMIKRSPCGRMCK